MKIIETRTAPNPRRVRIFLAEKGITGVVFEDVDLYRDLKTSGFSACNPLQRVPVLMLDDGTAIAETMAICRYFEETHPEPALFGVGAAGKGVTEMWNRRMELGLFFHISQVFRHLHPKMAELEVPQVAAWGEANRPKAIAMLEFLDARLAAVPFIAGDAFSVADITALVAIDFMKPARIVRPSGLANLERWYVDVSGRPSAAA